MKNSLRFKKINFFLWVLFLTVTFILAKSTPDGFAYTDQITVKAEEAWLAAQDVLKPHGLKKVDSETYTLETNWIKDRVMRSRGLLKNFAKQSYERRYRITVMIRPRDYDTEIEVRGYFQERPIETLQHLISWRKYKLDMQDLDVERQTFMRILNRLELSRTGSL